MRRIRFLVTGRVQGVAFRAYAAAEARRLCLAGFVQNRRDGAVFGEAQGQAAAVDAFAAWLQRGSPLARVERVELQDLSPVPGAEDFAVRR